MNRLTVSTAEPREPYAAKLRSCVRESTNELYRFMHDIPTPAHGARVAIHYSPEGCMATEIVCDETSGEDELELLEGMARHGHQAMLCTGNSMAAAAVQPEAATASDTQDCLKEEVLEKEGGGRGRRGGLDVRGAPVMAFSHVVRPPRLRHIQKPP